MNDLFIDAGAGQDTFLSLTCRYFGDYHRFFDLGNVNFLLTLCVLEVPRDRFDGLGFGLDKPKHVFVFIEKDDFYFKKHDTYRRFNREDAIFMYNHLGMNYPIVDVVTYPIVRRHAVYLNLELLSKWKSESRKEKRSACLNDCFIHPETREVYNVTSLCKYLHPLDMINESLASLSFGLSSGGLFFLLHPTTNATIKIRANSLVKYESLKFLNLIIISY